jgi:hypothetical protein
MGDGGKCWEALLERRQALIAWLLRLLGRQDETPVYEPILPGKRRWTFMVYIAGDNNLDSAARKDLLEMKAVGSSDEINVIAQLDGLRQSDCCRYYIRRGGALQEDVVERLPEANTGDPRALDDFLAWAAERYPAEHYALVLWNHGMGWKDEDVYSGLARQTPPNVRLTRGQVRGLASGKPAHALFRSTIEELAAEAALTQRAILYDDSSADFLDNVEMKAVLDQAAARFMHKIDLLGCDACLMNMLEVAYQVRGSCQYLVASQEEEPGDGWPYDLILGKLTANPQMTPALLAATIVQEYNRFYRENYPNLPVTQSALDLDKLEALAEAVDQLADTLRATLEADWKGGNAMISLALYEAQKFADRDYVDLIHLCQLLARQNPETAVAGAASGVINLIKRGGEESPLVAEGHSGPGMRFAGGVSIYFPERAISPLYERLEYAKERRWDQFLIAKSAPHPRATRYR